MSSHPERIVIATRESRLALWQAEHVRGLLQKLYPACQVELLGMTTRGDQILDRPLSKVGGKGLFVKELETALLDRAADIAVHSMKDVPMQLAPEFALVAIGPREVPLDAFVSNKLRPPRRPAAGRGGRHLQPAPRSAIACQLSVSRRDQPARQSRHAAAQARRRPVRRHHPRRRRPDAPGAGRAHPRRAAGRILAACRRTGRAGHRGAVDRGPKWRLDGSRSTMPPRPPACAPSVPFRGRWPAAARCRWAPMPNLPTAHLRLRGFVATPDGTRIARAEHTGPAADPEALGLALVADLRAQGADRDSCRTGLAWTWR